jgi:sterol 3beta-glucosyltransferase
MIYKPVKLFRKNAGLPEKYSKLKLPSIYGISQYFLKKPADYPKDSHFTGFWVSPSREELSQDLTGFISQGEPPLLLTFGSMPFNSKLNLSKLLNRFSEDLKIRVIVVKGWGLTETQELEHNIRIRVISSAPYDKLFPYITAAIHHGGIGTIAACLYAGKPFLSCPVLYPMGDQHFWGIIAYKRGVALKPVPLKDMTENLFISKVRELTGTAQLYSNSVKMMENLKGENGLTNAANIIENCR